MSSGEPARGSDHSRPRAAVIGHDPVRHEDLRDEETLRDLELHGAAVAARIA
jgi:hypothetical protein